MHKKSLGLRPSIRRTVRPTHREAARLGQHFLMHARIAERIADVARLSSDTTVVEVGPGRGILTRALLDRVNTVIAVEADRELISNLEQMFEKEIADRRLELVHADIRDYPLHTAIALNSGYSVVANIPYYLTGELF